MLSIPQHIKWKLNDIEFGDYSSIPLDEKILFEFSYENLYEGYDPSINFKQAIRNRLIELSSKKLAICVSGVDSEIIAREAKDLGLDFELFFLSNWGLNDYMLALCEQLATELGAKLNVISVTREDAFAFTKEYFQIVRVNKPTYLILPMLFNSIPEDFYIICGEGDINKSDEYYLNIDLSEMPTEDFLRMATTEISYWIWARNENRAGDFYFYSSTKQLILSDWNSPFTQFNCPSISNRETIKQLWGDNLIFTTKTTNWDTEEGATDNLLMRLENQKGFPLDREFKNRAFYNVVIPKFNDLTK